MAWRIRIWIPCSEPGSFTFPYTHSVVDAAIAQFGRQEMGNVQVEHCTRGVGIFILRFDLTRSPQNLFQFVTKLVWLHSVENKPFYINLPTQPIKLDSKWSLWQQNCYCLTLYAPTQIWWDHSSTLRLIIWILSSLNKKKTFKLFYCIKDIILIKSIFTLTWNLIISQTLNKNKCAENLHLYLVMICTGCVFIVIWYLNAPKP